MQKSPKRISRHWLVISGCLVGVYLNIMLTFPFSFILTTILAIVLLLVGGTCTLFIARMSWDKDRRLGKPRKMRLFLFGLSLASFVFAAGDLVVFLLSPHGQHQQLFAYSDTYPYLWLGTLPLVSFIGSAVSGGFFSLLERYLELHEKKDL